MTQSNYVLITILVCALCTQVTRWLPFLLFGGKKEVPGLVRYLGTILPAAIMAVLVVYCLKGITPLAYPYGLPELISVAVVVGLHLWKGNTLASIALGTPQFRIFHILPSFRYSTFRSLLYRTNCTIEGRKSLQRNYYNIFIRHLRQIITYV